MYKSVIYNAKFARCTTLVIFVVFSFMNSTSAQEYFVVKTGSNNLISSNNKPLRQGQKLATDAKLEVVSGNAEAVLIDKKGQLYRITSDAEYQGAVSEIVTKINEYKTQRGFKKVEKKQVVNDLKEYFGKGTYTLIGDSIWVQLDQQKYPLNNDQFIVFHYKVNGEQVSKKLGFNHQHLILHKGKLKKGINGVQKGDLIKHVAVYQYERSTETTEFITRFNLRFVSVSKLAKEFTVIKKATMAHYEKHKDLIELFREYVDAVYDNTDKYTLNRVLRAVKYQ